MLQNIDPVILFLILANALFTWRGLQDYTFFERFKFQVNRITNGEKIRMLSSGFLHADWIHFAFNMWGLYLFGEIVLLRLGVVGFLIVYFGSLLTGSLYSYSYHKKEPYYSAIGASGAVSGIVYSCILLVPETDWTLMFFPFFPIKAYVLGFVYMLYTIYGMKRRIGNVGHSAHLGGAMGGFAFTLLLFPQVFNINTNFVIILSVPILLLVFFGKKLNI